MPKPRPIVTSVNWPAPEAMPSAAASQMLAAEVRLWTLPAETKIAPAATKPTAWARPWITRKGSIPVSPLAANSAWSNEGRDGDQGGAERHERMGADARRDAAQLAVDAEQKARQRGEPQPQRDLLARHGVSSIPRGRTNRPLRSQRPAAVPRSSTGVSRPRGPRVRPSGADAADPRRPCAESAWPRRRGGRPAPQGPSGARAGSLAPRGTGAAPAREAARSSRRPRR